MKLTCGIVQIVKINSSYSGITVERGMTGSLGSYNSLIEMLEEPLNDQGVTPAITSALMEIRRKAEEFNWDENALFAAMP